MSRHGLPLSETLKAAVLARLPRMARNSPVLASTALAVLLAVGIARVLMTLTGGLPRTKLPAASAGNPQPVPHQNIDVAAIVAAHLFGIAADDPAKVSATAATLLLAGVIATDDPKQGAAIISGDGPSQLYTVGRTVGGALLQSVYCDRVILDRSGRLETLRLPRQALIQSTSYQPQQSNPVAGDDNAVEQADPHKLADLMRVGGSVENGDGKMRGFRIFPGRSRSAFSGSGLHGGDLVIAVNGTSVEDQGAQQGQQIFDAFKSSAIAMLTVERNGQTRDITVDLAQAGGNASAEPPGDPASASPAQ